MIKYPEYHDGINSTPQALYAAMLGCFVIDMYPTYEEANRALEGCTGKLRVVLVPSGAAVTVFGDTVKYCGPIQ